MTSSAQPKPLHLYTCTVGDLDNRGKFSGGSQAPLASQKSEKVALEFLFKPFALLNLYVNYPKLSIRYLRGFFLPLALTQLVQELNKKIGARGKHESRITTNTGVNKAQPLFSA